MFVGILLQLQQLQNEKFKITQNKTCSFILKIQISNQYWKKKKNVEITLVSS